MKQRVVIAMALACNPHLLLADEPTTALDVTIQAQVLELMKDLMAKFDTALLMITHDLGVVAEICNKCAVVYAGEVVEFGTVEQIFNNPRHPYNNRPCSVPCRTLKRMWTAEIDQRPDDGPDGPAVLLQLLRTLRQTL